MRKNNQLNFQVIKGRREKSQIYCENIFQARIKLGSRIIQILHVVMLCVFKHRSNWDGVLI